jgi:hypothetical protein
MNWKFDFSPETKLMLGDFRSVSTRYPFAPVVMIVTFVVPKVAVVRSEVSRSRGGFSKLRLCGKLVALARSWHRSSPCFS